MLESGLLLALLLMHPFFNGIFFISVITVFFLAFLLYCYFFYSFPFNATALFCPVLQKFHLLLWHSSLFSSSSFSSCSSFFPRFLSPYINFILTALSFLPLSFTVLPPPLYFSPPLLFISIIHTLLLPLHSPFPLPFLSQMSSLNNTFNANER